MLDYELDLACTSNRVYAAVSFATVFVGVIALTPGVGMEFITPIVLTGAFIVGLVNVYWLLDGQGAY